MIRYSWPAFVEPLDLVVQRVTVDGEEVELDAQSRRAVIAADGDGDWSEVRLSMVVSTDEAIPDGLAEAPLAAHATLSAETGYSRIPVHLSRQDGRLEFEGSLTVYRSEIGGASSLVAYVTTRIDDVPHRVVGQSEDWTVVLDKTQAPPRVGSSPIRHEWISFADPPPGVGIVTGYASQPHYLDLRTEEPVLYLNTDIDKLQNILGADQAKGRRKDVRDLMASQIAAQLTSTLLRSGFEEIRQLDDGTISSPTNAAIQRAFEAVARQMESVADLPELYERIARGRTVEDPSHMLLLWAEMELAVAKLVDVGDTFAAAVKRAFYDG